MDIVILSVLSLTPVATGLAGYTFGTKRGYKKGANYVLKEWREFNDKE